MSGGFNPFNLDPWKRKQKPQQQQIRRQICPQCQGRGQVWHNDVWKFGWKPCQACRGTGFVEYRLPPWER